VSSAGRSGIGNDGGADRTGSDGLQSADLVYEPATLAVLAECGVGGVGGIRHGVSGDTGLGARCLDLGRLFSLAGPVTYPNARALPDVARFVPVDRLVVETDSPYLPPQPYRGKRNEPAYLALTVARVAELRGERVESLAPRLAENARALFGLASS